MIYDQVAEFFSEPYVIEVRVYPFMFSIFRKEKTVSTGKDKKTRPPLESSSSREGG